MDEALVNRDRRLRRRMLSTLKLAAGHARGGMTARALVEQVNSLVYGEQRIGDDEHALRLMRELEQASYLRMRDERKHPKHEAYTLDAIFCLITHVGSGLLDELVPVDAMVEDMRDPE